MGNKKSRKDYAKKIKRKTLRALCGFATLREIFLISVGSGLSRLGFSLPLTFIIKSHHPEPGGYFFHFIKRFYDIIIIF